MTNYKKIQKIIHDEIESWSHIKPNSITNNIMKQLDDGNLIFKHPIAEGETVTDEEIEKQFPTKEQLTTIAENNALRQQGAKWLRSKITHSKGIDVNKLMEWIRIYENNISSAENNSYTALQLEMLKELKEKITSLLNEGK